MTDVVNHNTNALGTDGVIDIYDVLAFTSVTSVAGQSTLNLFSDASLNNANLHSIGTVKLEVLGIGIAFVAGEITNYITGPDGTDIIINLADLLGLIQ